MSTEISSNIQNVVLVIDIQEGMWESELTNGYDNIPDEAMRKSLQRIEEAGKANRKMAIDKIAPEIQDFTEKMRSNGAHIIWSISDKSLNKNWGDIHQSITPDSNVDSFLIKTAKSSYEEHIDFFQNLKMEAENSGKNLQFKICGVWSNACIAATTIDLNSAGFDVQVVNDMILNSSKPHIGLDRPGNREDFDLRFLSEETGIGANISDTSENILDTQEKIQEFMLQSIQENSDIGLNLGL